MLQSIFGWLSDAALGHFVREVSWVIPILQTLHIIAIAALLGSTVMLNLRVLGVFRHSDVTIRDSFARHFPWLVAAFVVLAVTGGALIAGEPERALDTGWPPFVAKLSMIAVALAITLWLRRIATRIDPMNEADAFASPGVKVAAVCCLLLWIGVVAAGRVIAYW